MTSVRDVVAIDLHAAGEPGRVLLGGVPDLPGDSMFAKMQYFARNLDALRLRMLREPRGYPAANCNIVLPPTDPRAAAGYIILEQLEYPPMSGSNTICVATALIEMGMVEVREPLTEFILEAPAGLIQISAIVKHGRAERITFQNVPSFVMSLDVLVDVPTLGSVTVDIAWGGMIYVIIDATALGLALTADRGRELARVGEMIKVATREQAPHSHPEVPELVGPTIALLSGPPSGPHADLRNTVVVSTGILDWTRPETWTGALDRSPCGTGTCARMASLHARGQLGLGTDFRHEGVLGTVFTGRLIGETTVAGRPAVVPTISGRAYVTGYARYVLDPADPFPEGFTVSDIWGAAAQALPPTDSIN
ncbi:MAG: proline racemase family protein [Candidatus Dormibacteria bacterium]